MELNNEAGAEVGSETVNTSGEQGTSSASAYPENYDAKDGADAGQVEPGAVEAEAPADDKPALPPLSVEEYQERHRQTTAALRETRQRERETRQLVERLQQELEQVRTTVPQTVERTNLDAALSEYGRIDWQAWVAQDPAAANEAWADYQALQARKGGLDEQDQQRQQETQQQQARQQLNALVSTLAEQETAFRETKPDYDKAIGFLKGELIKDANNQGIFGDAAEQAVTRHLISLGARVNAAGEDLAAFSYRLAEQRGYKTEVADIAPMIAGAEAAKTISDVGASGGDAPASFEEQMSGLSGAAARKFWEKAKKQQYS